MSIATNPPAAAAGPAETAAGSYFPTERDREIYHARKVLGRPLVEIAAGFGLAPRTVRNIVLTVGDALAQRLSFWDHCSPQELVLMAQQLEAQWDEMMGAWHASKKEQKVLRITRDGERKRKTETIRPQTGNARYVAEARRILSERRVLLLQIAGLAGEQDRRASQGGTLEEQRQHLLQQVKQLQTKIDDEEARFADAEAVESGEITREEAARRDQQRWDAATDAAHRRACSSWHPLPDVEYDAATDRVVDTEPDTFVVPRPPDPAASGGGVRSGASASASAADGPAECVRSGPSAAPRTPRPDEAGDADGHVENVPLVEAPPPIVLRMPVVATVVIAILLGAAGALGGEPGAFATGVWACTRKAPVANARGSRPHATAPHRAEPLAEGGLFAYRGARGAVRLSADGPPRTGAAERYRFGSTLVFSLSAAQRAIIVAGCLGTAYQQLLLSPANVEYAKSLGASDVHIGILNALPFTTLFMQFVAALVVNHLAERRWLWMALSVAHRLIFVPLTLCVWLVPGVDATFWLWTFLIASAVNHASLHFCSPLWLSWMGDYLPHEGLSQYWGLRQLWLHWAAAATLGGSAIAMYQIGLEPIPAFTVLCVLGGILGVADVLLFLWVEEPPVTPSTEPSLTEIVSEPFYHEGFRSFITYACYWNFAAMIAAPFISLYLLEHVGMKLHAVLLLWAASWVGGALVAGRWGHLCETFGHRPVLVLCTMFKTINMLALLFVPSDPNVAFWILVPVFMGDQVLNSGIAIACNGYMLKHSPSENRTMYLAAGTAVAGMVGGLTGIAAGAILDSLHGFSWHLGMLTLSGFHILFFVSTFFRLGAVVLARGVHEPGSESTMTLVWHLATGAMPPAPAHWGEFPVAQAARLCEPEKASPSQPAGVIVHVDAAAPATVPAAHLPSLTTPSAAPTAASAVR